MTTTPARSVKQSNCLSSWSSYSGTNHIHHQCRHIPSVRNCDCHICIDVSLLYNALQQNAGLVDRRAMMLQTSLPRFSSQSSFIICVSSHILSVSLSPQQQIPKTVCAQSWHSHRIHYLQGDCNGSYRSQSLSAILLDAFSSVQKLVTMYMGSLNKYTVTFALLDVLVLG